MQPCEQLRSKRNGNEGEFQFERPLRSLVAEQGHARKPAEPAADTAKDQESFLRNTLARTPRLPFVIPERKQSYRAPKPKPNKGGLIQMRHVPASSSERVLRAVCWSMGFCLGDELQRCRTVGTETG